MSTSRKGKRVAVVLAVVVAVGVPLAAWLSWPHLRFWYLFESIGLNAQGFPEYRHRATGIIMVLLPGGTFWMGAQKDDPEGRNYDWDALEDEGPVHYVTLSPFLMAKYEVTQAQWKQVMGSSPSHFKGGELPVEQVPWDDIQRFEVVSGLGLPTEAQWEYACRARKPGVFCCGDGADGLGEYSWYGDNSESATHPIGQKQPNDFGLHDMHGNVWEWCEDVYQRQFYSTSEAAGLDPLCNASPGPVQRVFRGGCWGSVTWNCRSADRGRTSPAVGWENVGFRPAAPCP